jgi:hypothetical protein
LKTLICLELSGRFRFELSGFATSCVRPSDSTVLMDGETLGDFAIAVSRAQNLREHEIFKRARAVAGPWSNLVFSACGPPAGRSHRPKIETGKPCWYRVRKGRPCLKMLSVVKRPASRR